MPVQPDLARLSVSEFRNRIRGETVPLSNQFSYFVAALPLQEEDLRDYLNDPIAALPASLIRLLPKVTIILVPFLEKANGKSKNKAGGGDFVCFERPADGKLMRSLVWLEEGDVVLAFGIQDFEVADYHHELFQKLAWLACDLYSWEELADYHGMLREELNLHVHGEVDEKSWRFKQALTRRSMSVKGNTKAFREYARHSFVDTLTLYLHGICCDIDVDPGPRQLQSRYLRRRLKFFKSMLGPPEGYAVFPEDQDAQPGE